MNQDTHTYLNQVYNSCFPLRQIKSNYCNRKPWLTYQLKESIKRKNELSYKVKRNNDAKLEYNYKIYKRVLQKTLRAAEKDYYDKLFNEYKSDLIKSWRTIKQVINKNKTYRTSSTFSINNKETDDKLEIAEGFNKFYVNLGPSLAEKIPRVDKDPVSYIKNNTHKSIFLQPVSDLEVVKILKSLKQSSEGWDDISPRIVKNTYTYFLTPLVHICNLSLLHGIFPNELKLAKVIPLFKGGDCHYLVNYRPVSVLPVFSKVLERIMYNRVLEFIEENNLLYNLQFGFRKGHSTSIALTILSDKISKALHEGDFVLGVFLDFSKAFDTVNHDILLRKLYRYGIRGIANDWFRSYLSNRTQFVNYNNTKSSELNITCGVPQGSILGPLLFLIYINDIAHVSKLLYMILFADDTNAFLTGRNVDDMIKQMNTELDNLKIWLYANRLSLNISKTHFILFRSSGLHKPVFSNDVIINDQVVKQETSTKFLGVIMDERLSWKEHIQHIKIKIAKGLGILYKARRLLRSDTLLTLYYSFIYPYYNYAIEVWGDTYKSYTDTLVKLQKRAIRVITFSSKYEHTLPLFNRLNVLQVRQVFIYKIGLLMFKVFHKLTPVVFSDLFVRNSSIHDYGTRQASLFHVPVGRTDLMKRAISNNGVRIWNFLANRLSVDCSYLSFKIALKKYLAQSDGNTIDIF